MFEYSWHLSALYHLVWPCNYKDKEFDTTQLCFRQHLLKPMLHLNTCITTHMPVSEI